VVHRVALRRVLPGSRIHLQVRRIGIAGGRLTAFCCFSTIAPTRRRERTELAS
jgi:hypothetical protein